MKLKLPRLKPAEMADMRFAVLAAIVLSFSLCLSAQDTSRISATWQVERYDISAQLPASETDRNLNVKAKLDLRNVSAAPAGSLTLRISPNANISSVTVNGNAADFTKAQENVGSGTLQRISMRIPPVAAGTTATAVVDYKLTLKDNSGIASL